MASYSNITIEQGTSFDAVIDIVDSDLQPLNLTGMTAKCEMKKSYYTSSFETINAEIYGDPLNGQVKIYLTPTESIAMKPGRYVYDLIVQNGDNSVVERAVQGVVNLTPAITSIT